MSQCQRSINILADKRCISFGLITVTMNKDQEMLMGRGFSPCITMKKQAEYWSGKVNHEICIFMTEIIEFTKSKTINSMR